MPVSVTYRVQIYGFADTTTYGVGSLLAEFENAKNVGWGEYLNDVPEAFFTVNQDDPKVQLIRPYKGRAHVRIYRNADLVFGGWLGEFDANDDDVVVYAYGYLAATYWMVSDWNTQHKDVQIDTIVSALWTRIKTTLTNSLLGWVTTGTIEAPVTTSGGSTAIVLPYYAMYYKRALFAFRELAAIGMSDTTNTVVFEITPSGTFNFWKNRGQDRPEVLFELGDGKVAGFRELSFPVFHRNDLPVVGSAPNDLLLRTEATNSSDITTYGRRMEPIYFSWIRDETELERASALRLARALRDDTEIQLRFFPDAVAPLHANGGAWRLGDRVKVKVQRGITNIDEYRMVTGCQVVWTRGAEHVRIMTQQRPGS